MLTWVNEFEFLGQPTPTGWPASAGAFPPPKPLWWPDGLAYPPIGDAWATTAPSWWTLGNQAGNLPNWPPPKPDNWPANFPWPVPPSTLQATMPCADLCDARFGDKGTTPNAQTLIQCKLSCQIAATHPEGAPTQPGGFQVAPQTTSPALAPAKKTSSAAPILIVLGLLAVGALVISLSGPGTSVRD